jgi:hypothetical protein
MQGQKFDYWQLVRPKRVSHVLAEILPTPSILVSRPLYVSQPLLDASFASRPLIYMIFLILHRRSCLQPLVITVLVNEIAACFICTPVWPCFSPEARIAAWLGKAESHPHLGHLNKAMP